MNLICNLELEDLNKLDPCESRSKGVKILYFARPEDVKKLPTIPKQRNKFEDYSVLSEGGVTLNGTEHSIEMKKDKKFFKFFSKKDFGELKYTGVGSSGGRSFTANLEIMHPGMGKKILGFMTAAANRDFILLVRLNNGEIHLLGDLERGAEFGDTVEATSGKTQSDEIGVTFNFTYDTSPQLYIGDVEGLFEKEISLDSGSGN